MSRSNSPSSFIRTTRATKGAGLSFATKIFGCLCLLFAICMLASAQESESNSGTVPSLVNFSGLLVDANGKPLTGNISVTFSLYKDRQVGAAIWIESQNVQVDKTGHYSVMLGSTTNQGLPAELFSSGEAR
ncbi:MAG TPA: hypothetical protein VK670_10915, partial [Silvibacterium sp.]|nr:hypothetical protein [Silvibacterium sp.]